MARPALNQATFKVKAAQHVATMRAALRTLERPLDDTVVCDCDAGNAEGITAAECGCEHAEAARAIEAAGCYIRRGIAQGFTL